MSTIYPHFYAAANKLSNLSRFLGEDIHKRWKFHPHQFRRFFAMVYFWRYEPGDVAALAHHLRHFDLEMTRQYVTDDGFSRIWQDVAEERQRDVLASVVDGSRWVRGPAGERLKARIDTLKHHYRRDVQVVAAKRSIEKLLRLAKKWGSACKLHAWRTICVYPQKGYPDQGRHAHCCYRRREMARNRPSRKCSKRGVDEGCFLAPGPRRRQISRRC